MAEALFNATAPAGFIAVSAGTEPSDAPHDVVIEAMREAGIDVAGHHGRVLTDEMVKDAERVITMGCAVDEATCPAIRYAGVEDWKLPDPKGKPLEEVRKIRDDIRRRVRLLSEALL